MSNIYVSEPNTKGKVTLRTSFGDLDIELWSKEAPKACRNFLQLCAEGFYDETIFHRVIKDFLIQGGDPTGSGTGGESIYEGGFPDEYHSRLKFRHRGLVAVANQGKGTNTNGSQFFITLNRAESLNNTCTIFGKIDNNTIYNLLNMNDIACDENDRPLDPPRILSSEIIDNPFEDLAPRNIIHEHQKQRLLKKQQKGKKQETFEEEPDERQVEKRRAEQMKEEALRSKKMKGLLSFMHRKEDDDDDDDDDDEEEEKVVDSKRKGNEEDASESTL